MWSKGLPMDLVRHPLPELKTIPDILRLQASDQPEALAILDEEATLTYRELAERTWSLAARIASYQPRTVALLIPRSSTYVIAYFASLSIGATVVPLDPGLTQAEIDWTLKFCKAELLLYTEQDSELVENLKTKSNSVILWELKPQDYTSEEPVPKKEDLALWPTDPESVALLLHTSGSLAKPKRVMLKHGALISNASAHSWHMGLTSDDRVLILLPMHFGYCNTAQMLAHLLLGGALVILRGPFVPHRCLRLVQEYRVTTFTAVPTMLLQLQAFKHRKKYNTSSLRQISFGGAPFPLERLQQLTAEYPTLAFCQTYGQTEAGPRVTGVRLADASRWLGSVGTPIPGVTVQLLGESGQPVRSGEEGEFVVKSPGVMKGYFGAPDETAAVLREGWLYTGDLGRQGPEGEFYIVGRLKNFIIRGGINIYPEEIESTLLKHPAVGAALVYGVPHLELGEVPHACIVLSEQARVTANELRDFASARLAAYKLPVIELVKELPKTYNGKIARRQK
jgi:long-chain acyl-CoA synthetase